MGFPHRRYGNPPPPESSPPGAQRPTAMPKSRVRPAPAKHELEYKNVKDDSIFVKFKVVGSQNEYLVIWTTTPWTIPFNLAVMVHPELEYVKAEVEGEVWIVAKGLAGLFLNGVAEKEYKIREELMGKELEGLKSSTPSTVS